MWTWCFHKLCYLDFGFWDIPTFIQSIFTDDHDVVRFTVNSLRSPEMALASDSVQDAESKKFEDEFVEYQKKLDQQKDEWAQQNPDKVSIRIIKFWNESFQILED